MSIDVVEIMKTGLFELHYTRKGDTEEWSIVPTQQVMGHHYPVVSSWGENSPSRDWMFEWSDPYPADGYDGIQGYRVSPQFTDIDSLSKSLNWAHDIPWDEIPKDYDWVAMDKNGGWYAYGSCPEVQKDGIQWDEKDGVMGGVLNITDLNIPTPPHWTESLVRRPEE